jgi:hypothetical protein
VFDAYELRGHLRSRGYEWRGRNGHGWRRTIARSKAGAELAWLQSIGVSDWQADIPIEPC